MRLFFLYATIATSCAYGASSCDFQEKSGEPKICPQLPTRDGLIYMGTEDGLQRYTCGGDELARITVYYSQKRTVTGKYFDCNSTYFRLGSDGYYWGSDAQKVQVVINEFSCRDNGKIDQACPVPYHLNAWVQDGVLRCVKGFYLWYAGVIDKYNNNVTLYDEQIELTTATCEAGSGWRLDGTFLSELKFTHFVCGKIPVSIGQCPTLDIPERNIQQHSAYEMKYTCTDAESEYMVIETPAALTYWGHTLKCVSGEWKFTGVNTVSIPRGSKVRCEPKNMGDLPQPPIATPLIPIGKTPEGLMRWICIDSAVTLSLSSQSAPVHTPYIDFNNTFYKYYAMDLKSSKTKTSGVTVKSISCTDLGSKKERCASGR